MFPENPEFRDIGITEELMCGLVPIMDWLKARGITVTTEGQNGMPIDATWVVSGFWHYDPPLSSFQIWHRKLMGGGCGTRTGTPTRWEFGIVEGIHQDFTYLPTDRESYDKETWDKHFSWWTGKGGLTLSMVNDWPEIVDRIYRGTLLYHFFLKHQLTKWDNVPGGNYIEYDFGKVKEENANNHLKVTMADVVVAEDDDRFIPRDGAIYAYSTSGNEREWVLPKSFRRKRLQLFILTKSGRGAAPQYRLKKDRIWLKLEPGTPVKIALH